MPHSDAEVSNLFQQKFSRQLAPDVQSLLGWDGPIDHIAQAPTLPTNVKLVRPPPKCPS